MLSGESRKQPKKSKLLSICPFILGNECCERLAFYGVKLNLVNYFKRLGASSSNSASAVSAFLGLCYFFPIFGGWIADARIGRYKTILVFSILYVLGMVLLAGSAAIPGIKVNDGEDANGAQWTLLALGLIIVAVSTGGIKPNVSSFGADQFDDNIERDRKEKKSFFNWFYFFINIGVLLASTVIVKIQDSGYWGIGFVIPAAAMIVAVLLFVFGTPLYRMLPIEGSPLARFIGVTRCALTNRRKGIREASSSNAARKSHWLDWAVEEGHYTAEQVYEIKLVYKPWKIFLCLCVDAIIGVSLPAFWILQAEQMDRNLKIFGKAYTIPSASMTFFNTVAILVVLPLYDLCILPLMKKCFNYSPTSLQRIGVGLFMQFLNFFYSCVLEWNRLKLYREGKFHLSTDDNGSEVDIVELSIWWLSVSYIVSALFEVATNVGALEFFYSQAPDSMKSIMASLSLLIVATGGFLSSFLLFILDAITTALGSKWITNNLNEGHLNYYFLLMFCISGLVFVWFVYIAMHYEYKTEIEDQDFETVPILNLVERKSISFPMEENDSLNQHKDIEMTTPKT
eukprot:g5730.t1